MKMAGQERIAAPRARVWEALNDPDTLRKCIPGCQSLERETPDKLRAIVEIKIGPIGARFNSVITLSEVRAPDSYTLLCEGQGGTAGSAKATIKVQLSDESGATVLTFSVDADVGGRLAQLGGPLIDATAKHLATKFFRLLAEVISNAQGPATTTSNDVARDRSATKAPYPIAWILALIVAALAGYFIGRETTPQVVLDEKLLEHVLRDTTGGAK
jgi:uncharacterized protein